MSKYAEDTKVPVENSKAEIERMLSRYGADQFLSGWDSTTLAAFVQFRARNRMVRFAIKLPAMEDFREVQHKGRHWPTRRTDEQTRAAWEQGLRQRWRALALVIKAKLESVDSGIESFEDAFLAHVMLPDGSPFGKWAGPALAAVYETGRTLPAHDPGLAGERAP